MGVSKQIKRNLTPKKEKESKKKKQIKSSAKKTPLIQQVGIIILVAVICLGSVLSISALQNWQAKSSSKSTAAEAISKDEIMVGEIFNRENAEYNVIVYDSKKNDNDTITKLAKQYETAGIKTYKVDTSSSLNTSIISAGTVINLGAQDAKTFKVSEAPTVLELKNKEITAVTTGTDNVKGLLK